MSVGSLSMFNCDNNNIYVYVTPLYRIPHPIFIVCVDKFIHVNKTISLEYPILSGYLENWHSSVETSSFHTIG